MNKKQFLKKLAWNLRGLKRSERKKYLSDYEEMIADMIENGMTEQQAIAKLGDIETICMELLGGYKTEKRVDIPGTLLIVVSFLLLLFTIVERVIGELVFGTFGLYTNKNAEGASVSIIGGADGPTSIFLAGKVNHTEWLPVAAAVCVVITIVYFVWKNRRK